jgi:hypothetical protein
MGPEVSFTTAELAKVSEQIEAQVLRVQRRAVVEVTREAELALEAATAAAGLGRLAKAWTSRVFPRSGLAHSPSGLIYPKGGKSTAGSIRAFARGASIRGTRGQFLAIPLPVAGGRMIGRGAGAVAMTPQAWERKTGQELRPVFRRGKAPLLVADGRVNMRSGRFRKSLKRDARRIGPGFGAVVPVFILMPVVNLGQRFSIEGTMAPFPGRLADRAAVLIRGD